MAVKDLLTLEQKGAWRSFWRSVWFQIVPALLSALAVVITYVSDPRWLQDALGIDPIWAPMAAGVLGAFVGSILRAKMPNVLGSRKETM